MMAVPGLLPSCMALLCLPHSHLFLRLFPILRLSGYRLSSNPPEPSVSLHECLDTLPTSGCPPPGRTIGPRGLAWSARHDLSVARPSVPRASSFLLPLVRSLRSSLGVFLTCFLSSGSSLATGASCALGTFQVVHLSALSGALSQRRGSSGSLISGVLLRCCPLLVFLA